MHGYNTVEAQIYYPNRQYAFSCVRVVCVCVCVSAS